MGQEVIKNMTETKTKEESLKRSCIHEESWSAPLRGARIHVTRKHYEHNDDFYLNYDEELIINSYGHGQMFLTKEEINDALNFIELLILAHVRRQEQVSALNAVNRLISNFPQRDKEDIKEDLHKSLSKYREREPKGSNQENG